MTTADQARETQRRRFQFLHRCYDVSQANLQKILKTYEIGEELSFGDQVTAAIVRYLHDKGLLKVMNSAGSIARMTSRGIDEVEKALQYPDESTQHFAAINIIHVGQMTDSQIQQASPAAVQLLIREDRYEQLQEALNALKESIDELSLAQQEIIDLKTDIQTIEAQMSRSTPSRTILTELVLSIVRIFEQATGTVVGGLLLAQFQALLGG